MTSYRMSPSFLLALCFALAPTARAEGEEDEDEERGASPRTVVTSTHTHIRPEEQPRALTVVTREDLSNRPARTTAEALSEAEGVFLQKTSHAGGAPIIRGLYGQQVLLLVDGVRLNNATVRAGPNQFLNTVDSFLVEWLEVLRGPGSVLYGSDALGGVVDVRTFWPRFSSEVTPTASLVAQGGTADSSLQGHLRAGVSLADTALAATLTLRDFNDLRGGALVGLQRYTGYEEGGVALKLRHRLGPGLQLSMQYQGVRQANAPRLDRSWPGDFRRFTEQHRDLVHARLAGTALGPFRRLMVEASVHRQGDRTERFRVARDRLERDDVNVWTAGLRTEGEVPLGVEWLGMPTLVLGADLFHDRVTSAFVRGQLSEPGSLTPRPRDARYTGAPTALAGGLFGMLTSDVERPFSYHGGARIQLNQTRLPEDSRLHETFSSSPQPPPILPASVQQAVGVAGELGVSQRLLPGVSLLLNLGSGFRAPNVDDYLRMGVENSGFFIPGRNLRPEQSYTAEVGARLRHERVSAQVFYAFTTISGLVGNVPALVDGQPRTPDGVPYLIRQNRERAWVQSLEAALTYRVLPRLTLATHGMWTHTRQRRRDLTVEGQPLIEEPLSRTPPLNGLVRATWEPRDFLFFEGVARWALAQEAFSAADRLDVRTCAEVPDCARTPGFRVFHLRAGARLGRLSASLTLQNLLDATYRTHGSGVDEPGRSAVFSLEASL
jgi:hemoglobin/transferrin/lactoferrin receptor protein